LCTIVTNNVHSSGLSNSGSSFWPCTSCESLVSNTQVHVDLPHGSTALLTNGLGLGLIYELSMPHSETRNGKPFLISLALLLHSSFSNLRVLTTSFVCSSRSILSH
jgi:hypothetical protein